MSSPSIVTNEEIAIFELSPYWQEIEKHWINYQKPTCQQNPECSMRSDD